MARPSRFNNPTPNGIPTQNSRGRNPRTANHPTSPAHDPQPAPPRQEDTNNNRVSGPTSALTSFLKEQGIRPRNVNRFSRVQPEASTSATTAANGSTIPEEEEEEEKEQEEEPDHSTDDIDSDDIDGIRNPPRSKTKPKRTREGKQKATDQLVVAQGGSSKISIKKREDSPGPSKPKPGKYADRKPGHITTCVECSKRFTVTPYTVHARELGQLCDDCAKEKSVAKADQNQGLPALKKRKTKKHQSVKPVWSEDSIQTLQMACISVIANEIDSIDALGHVAKINLDKICEIVCKHRELKPTTLPLFLDVSHSDLKLTDCIHLRKDSLLTIPAFCPQLERLKLSLCGHLDGEVMTTFAKKLTRLTELDLFGAYLVRKEAWIEVFNIWNTERDSSQSMVIDDEAGQPKEGSQVEAILQGPEIRTFKLKQSPRFSIDCVKALVSTCPNLVNLTLDDIGLLDDSALDVISAAGLKHLRNLSIANAGIKNGATGEFLTDQAVLRLLKSVGSELETLDLSQNKNLTDLVLVEGIAQHCRHLISLNISELQEITTNGVHCLFVSLKEANASSLQTLRLSRCIKVGNQGLISILNHSGISLKYLDLNSVDELRFEALERLSERAVNLIELDLSFVRDVDDFFIKSVIERMNNLKKLKVYGNNRVSDLCPSKKGLRIEGQERAIVVT